jgi:hypothetical protein
VIDLHPLIVSPGTNEPHDHHEIRDHRQAAARDHVIRSVPGGRGAFSVAVTDALIIIDVQEPFRRRNS